MYKMYFQEASMQLPTDIEVVQVSSCTEASSTQIYAYIEALYAQQTQLYLSPEKLCQQQICVINKCANNETLLYDKNFIRSLLVSQQCVIIAIGTTQIPNNQDICRELQALRMYNTNNYAKGRPKPLMAG
eukprot:TRINITY_DN13037_c0_g1_i1.p4 TRINITY_DN13037_c0_g1~~TRINITY_DN13037_c0_g1_i1.p4  ORF type:complete len:130 (-),score=4.25 TRINITY_DN13037_c0_g1_i1:14-403(-)